MQSVSSKMHPERRQVSSLERVVTDVSGWELVRGPRGPARVAGKGPPSPSRRGSPGPVCEAERPHGRGLLYRRSNASPFSKRLHVDVRDPFCVVSKEEGRVCEPGVNGVREECRLWKHSPDPSPTGHSRRGSPQHEPRPGACQRGAGPPVLTGALRGDTRGLSVPGNVDAVSQLLSTA